MVANKKDFTCEEDENRPGLEFVSDDDRYASGEKQLIKNDLDKLDFGNTLEKEIGGKTFDTAEYAVKLEKMHDQEAIEYKKYHNLKTETLTITEPALLQITSKLLQGLSTITSADISADISVPLVDDLCMVYEEGWKDAKHGGYKNIGMLIFGYEEKEDLKLKKKLDEAKSFKGNLFLFFPGAIFLFFFSFFLFFFSFFLFFFPNVRNV